MIKHSKNGGNCPQEFGVLHKNSKSNKTLLENILQAIKSSKHTNNLSNCSKEAWSSKGETLYGQELTYIMTPQQRETR